MKKLKLLNKEFIKLFVDETKIYDNLLMYNKNMFLLNIYMDWEKITLLHFILNIHKK